MGPWETFLFAVGMIVIIAGAYYTTWFVASRSMKLQKGRSLCVLERFALTRDKTLLIFEAGRKVYIVAMSGNAVTVVDSLQKEEFETAKIAGDSDYRRDRPVENSAKPGFLKIFSDRFGAAPAAEKPHGHNGEIRDGQAGKSEVGDEIDAMYKKIQARRASSGMNSRIREEIASYEGDVPVRRRDDTEKEKPPGSPGRGERI